MQSPDQTSQAMPEVPGFRIRRFLAEGYGGRVYMGRHLASGRKVALKLLSPDAAEDPVRRERFRREGSLYVENSHEGMVPLVASDLSGEPPYLALEYMEGGDLTPYCSPDRLLDPARVLDIGERLASALEGLHANGVVHRDVKPANIFLDQEGRAHLGDLGLGLGEKGSRITAKHQAVGTLAYMAPELVAGRDATAASDRFAFGIVLLELLTGARPQISSRGVKVPPELARRIPSRVLAGVLLRCLRSAPEDRPGTWEEVREAMVEARHELMARTEEGTPLDSEKVQRAAATGLAPRVTAPAAATVAVPVREGADRRRAVRLPLFLVGAMGVVLAMVWARTGSRTMERDLIPTLVLTGGADPVVALAGNSRAVGVLRSSGLLQVVDPETLVPGPTRPLFSTPGPRPRLVGVPGAGWVLTWDGGPVLLRRGEETLTLGRPGEFGAVAAAGGKLYGVGRERGLLQFDLEGWEPRPLRPAQPGLEPVALHVTREGRALVLYRGSQDFGGGVIRDDLRLLAHDLGAEDPEPLWVHAQLGGPRWGRRPVLLADARGSVLGFRGEEGPEMVYLDEAGEVRWQHRASGTFRPVDLLAGYVVAAEGEVLRFHDRLDGSERIRGRTRTPLGGAVRMLGADVLLVGARGDLLRAPAPL